MSHIPLTSLPPRRPLMYGWQRVLFTLGASLLWALLLRPVWLAEVSALLQRTVAAGLLALLAFSLFERWPQRLPAWFARWVLQLLGVAVSIPLCLLAIYVLSTSADEPPFWVHRLRLGGFGLLSVTGVMMAPWMALSALMRQRDAAIRDQAIRFERERGELERQALDARLRLLQAQVEPHFLFNTLANVRELVDSGSPQASDVLNSLIAYLRAAVPRLHDPTTTLGQEIDLVRAYLEVMHMRMPDRMQFSLQIDDAALPLHCPPMTLLTLVENAVRHGIDPSENGGQIGVHVHVKDGRCHAQVSDTGVGLRQANQGLGTGLGTGLSTLRERLQLTFAGDAQLRLTPMTPHGVCAELDFPVQ